MNLSQFKVWWCQQWASMFGMARISRPGEGENTADVVRVDAQTAGQPEIPLSLMRMEQFGDVQIPPPETPAVTLTMGAGGIVLSGPTAQRPTDGKAGDRGLYCSVNGCRIQLYGASAANPGRIIITAGDGAEVVVNGGTKKVAREGDPVGWLVSQYATLPTMPPAIVCTAILWSSVDQGLPPFPGLPIPAPGTYQQALHITGGAEHFLG